MKRISKQFQHHNKKKRERADRRRVRRGKAHRRRIRCDKADLMKIRRAKANRNSVRRDKEAGNKSLTGLNNETRVPRSSAPYEYRNVA